jgi:hypothetical protein
VTGAHDDPNGSHISIRVTSALFEGKRPVQRQQLVYKALWEGERAVDRSSRFVRCFCFLLFWFRGLFVCLFGWLFGCSVVRFFWCGEEEECDDEISQMRGHGVVRVGMEGSNNLVDRVSHVRRRWDEGIVPFSFVP